VTPAATRRSIAWAVIGGVVLLIAVIAIIVAGTAQRGDGTPPPTASATGHASPTASTPPTTSVPSSVVDPSVSRRGWLPEPITRDRDAYVRAALEAASTFDPRSATREEFLTYLSTWFTYDTRWADRSDRESSMSRYLLELSQSVVLPEDQWAAFRTDHTRVTAKTTGPITYTDVPDDPGGMYIGTADVTVRYTYGDANHTADERRVRVSVQVLCTPDTVPAPNSKQQVGDCKVIRYFPSAVGQ
jgi:hypothetical protein